MFTGIIRFQGKLANRSRNRLTIAVPRAVRARLKPGGSIAVNGVCLTVEDRIRNTEFGISVMPETLRVTTLGQLPIGSRLNLELPLRLGDPLDGHLVAGHVDGIGKVIKIERRGNSRMLSISLPSPIKQLVAPKGSIAVDGVSMTAILVSRGMFTIGVIPETARRTTLGRLRAGDTVNLEADLIARYVVHHVSKRKTQSAKRKTAVKNSKYF